MWYVCVVINAIPYEAISVVANVTKFTNIWIGVSSAQNSWKNSDGSPMNYTFPNLCDSGWSLVDQRCIQTDGLFSTWSNARTFCSNKGGVIVDDQTDDQHNYLLKSGEGSYFWIGLYNSGSGYYWDQGPGNAPIPNPKNNKILFPLNQSNQYWVGGGAVPDYDPTKKCVFFDGTQKVNTWTLGACDQPNYVMCQKNSNNVPSRQSYVQMSTNGSTAGQWVVASYSEQTNYFVCQLPQCGADGTSPASLISPGAQVPGIAYGNMTEAWYLSNQELGLSVSKAERLCAKMGAHLPSVGNAFKNSELLRIVKSNYRDITLGYKKSGGQWAWTDGNTATYTNWAA